MNKYNTTRQECVSNRPRTSKLVEYINSKKQGERENESGPHEAYIFSPPDLDMESSTDFTITQLITKATSFTDDDKKSCDIEHNSCTKKPNPNKDAAQQAHYGTPCALDYYPTTFRDSNLDSRSDAPSQRRSTPCRRRDLTSSDIKTSIRSIMNNSFSPHSLMGQNDECLQTRSALIKAVPKYARPRPSRLPTNHKRREYH